MADMNIQDIKQTQLTEIRYTGKSLALRPGETIRGRILDILPSGEVRLKLADAVITARTNVALRENASAFFKVLQAADTGSVAELKLQFSGYADNAQIAGEAASWSVLKDLLDELGAALNNRGGGTRLLQQATDRILEALPDEMAAVPRDVKLPLQELLRSSLTATGQSLQGEMDKLILQLQTALKGQPIFEFIPKNVLVNVADLTGDLLQTGLRDSGVGLEAKLKSLAFAGASTPDAAAQGKDPPRVATGSFDDRLQTDPLENDLKGGLLRLKHWLSNEREMLSSQPGDLQSESYEELHRTVDGLLQDIETLQLLSKVTTSFYAFLPVIWEQMKEGEIAFKRGPGGVNDTPYYCMINLDLEKLGKLFIMIQMQDKAFFASFKADHPKFAAILRDHAVELQEIFSEQGLHLKGVNVVGSDDTSLAPFERLEPLESLLNIKV